MGKQESVFHCFKAAMTLGVHGPQQVVLARKLHDHVVTSLANLFG